MAGTRLSDVQLAEIGRRLDNLEFPSPDEIRALISEIRDQRRHVGELSASQLRLAASLRAVRLAADAALQLETTR